MMLSEFESFDFLLPARLNLLPKLKYAALRVDPGRCFRKCGSSIRPE